jgi:hypothetical protein
MPAPGGAPYIAAYNLASDSGPAGRRSESRSRPQPRSLRRQSDRSVCSLGAPRCHAMPDARRAHAPVIQRCTVARKVIAPASLHLTYDRQRPCHAPLLLLALNAHELSPSMSPLWQLARTYYLGS